MIGKRLGGRYEIKSRVGGGGMAIVYCGHDILLDRTVAIKVLRSQFGTDEDFIRRFRREAQAAAKLTHPNVVNIYDVGQEEETHYIVMEYVEGETLKDLIKREAPLPVDRAVNITIQIAEALHVAHKHQIIHRDIKPHNILIGKNGNVKVTDFGIARAVTSATITHTGSVLGSVHYFSPEQAKGGLTGEKSDIYSLGVVLYEMVTGELPFSGDSPISVALKHLQEDFQDPTSLNPMIPQSLENIILRALSKDPDQRYQSAREMILDLETCLSSNRSNEQKFQRKNLERIDEPTIIIPAIRDKTFNKANRIEPIEDEISDDDDEDTEPNRRKKWITLAIWLGVFIVLAGIGFYVVQQVQSMFEVPEVQVPQLENKSLVEAMELLEESGLNANIKEMYHDQVEQGYVIKQDPKQGTSMKSGTIVNLTVSLGKETKQMPNVTDKQIREAQALLDAFSVEFIDIQIRYEHHEDIPADRVIDQFPPVGASIVPKETTVTLVVSKGGETFAMPSLIGMTLDQVKATLVKYGLELDPDIREKESFFDKGLVISQWPVPPGEQVAKGTMITIEVSSGIKDEAQRIIDEIPVILEEGTEVQVEIRITDARYTEQTVVKEIATETKFYEIEVMVAPGKDAKIHVYLDGIETNSKTITYDEVAGGE